ncbi:MAG: acyltransferase family protein [Desertimonas sp.]
MAESTAAAAPAAGAETSSLGYRPELDGLRGLAVVAVVVYHLDRSWLPGGYLGVDVFFTLSGFLITGILLADHEGGRVRLSRFWTRRARRLLPASLLVVLTVALWLSTQDDLVASTRRGDVLASLFQVQNWRLIATGESYFEGFAAPSPLRHFWSLAIEEQFYLVWPLLCAVLLRWGRRTLASVAAALGVASVVVMALRFDAADPSRAYYGTDSRIHQLLVGCLLAMGWPALDGWLRRSGVAGTRRLAGVTAGIGLAVVAAGAVAIADGEAFYYRGGSLLIALATAAVIAGCLVAPSPVRTLLSWPWLVAVGTVSYGLYLWHWPVIVWMPAGTWGLDGVPLAVAQVTVTATVTMASYRLVEQPIRRGRVTWLRQGRQVLAAAAASILAVAAVTIGVTWGVTTPDWAAAGAGTDVVGYGDGPTTVGVVGDSVAVSLLPGLVAEADRRGWTLLEGAQNGCPLTGFGQVTDDGVPLEVRDPCSRLVPLLRGEIAAARPDVVIWHDLQSTMGISTEDGAILAAGTDAWAAETLGGWAVALDELRATGADVVVIVPPWRPNRAPGDCRADSFTPRCEDLTAQDERIRAVTERFVATATDDPGVHVLILDDVLCPQGRPCPPELDGVEPRLMGRDRTHFTEAGAAWIAPTIADAVDAALAG